MALWHPRAAWKSRTAAGGIAGSGAGMLSHRRDFGCCAYLAQELIEPELNVVAVTGVSGAGKKAAVGLLGTETMGSLRAYSPGGTHRHTPEMVQNLAPFVHGDAELNLSFTPVLAPLVRGILATISAPLAGGVDASQVHKAFADFYKDEPFCLVLPEGIQPETQNVVGSNMVHIHAHVDGRARRLLITVALDNLTKGTAGAAVQCMNLALGLEEAATRHKRPSRPRRLLIATFLIRRRSCLYHPPRQECP